MRTRLKFLLVAMQLLAVVSTGNLLLAMNYIPTTDTTNKGATIIIVREKQEDVPESVAIGTAESIIFSDKIDFIQLAKEKKDAETLEIAADIIKQEKKRKKQEAKLASVETTVELEAGELHAFSPQKVEPSVEYDDFDLIARCVQAEAGNQSHLGKRLVAAVILNRVDSDRFPNTVYGVITQKNQFATWPTAIRNNEPTEDTIKAVEEEMEERTDSEIMFFTARRYNPSGTPAYSEGDHYFSTL